MTDYFGPGVSRVLQSDATQYTTTLWQAGKPPTDADLNLIQTLASDANRIAVLRGMTSGFLGNETGSQAAFITSATWSNFCKFGPQRTGEQQSAMWANVNGWVIPVTGTRTGTPPGSPNDTDITNIIALDPPPANSGDFRIDFAFLEVWQARIQPNPATTNKPAASAIYKYGNVEGGYSFLPDDLVDPALGFETNQRIQVQYRIRVVKGLVGLTSNPDGFDPVVVKAQGAASSTTSYTFTNMHNVLGDPGLWRAGDGTQNSLGTVDGYSYAVPIAAFFRRNSVTWNGNPSQNLNGAFNRNPTAVDRTGIKTFSTVPTLAGALTAAATTTTLTSASNIPMPTTPASAVLIQIDDELLTYSSITGTTLNGLSRGVNGTIAETHKAGSTIKIMSGRPDGLFSDQIALTDIFDLRHAVNPNGFNYETLLKSNLDKLLRGQLRANWKRSGGGPQGTFVSYQDTFTSGSVSLGVTKLDAPDNIRMVFSDAATTQPIECIVRPATGVVAPGPGVSINVTWGLNLTVKTTAQSIANKFTAGDIIVIPVNQLKVGLPGGDTDQVRWLNDSVLGAVSLRLDGNSGEIDPTTYTVTPAVPSSSDDLTITLGGSFPQLDNTSLNAITLHITVHAVYGAGRGLSRRPDSLHSVSYINPSSDLVVQPAGVPSSNQRSHISWAPLWSKFRNATFNNLLPSTSEVYADLGSKSIILSPFRRIDYTVNPLTVDGSGANPVPTPKYSSSTGETVPAIPGNVLTDTSSGTGTAADGDALIIPSGPGAGSYVIISHTGTAYTLDRNINIQATTSISYTVHAAQGLMPLNAADGVTPKWTMGTDPLSLFCGSSGVTPAPAAQKNIYISLPRHLVPSWGELHVPILPADTTTFSQGINFLTRSKSGSTYTDADRTYVNYNGSVSYAAFATEDLTSLVPAPYNTLFTYAGINFAGVRFFTDTRGLGRQGLELPPFYGVSRLFAVYEATDYIANGSAFDPTTRASLLSGGATNLLRQTMAQEDGPVLWIEKDVDGDSTFILNAKALDLSKSPTTISSFSAGNYVVESSIFGFDRGSFDLSQEFRLVMTRPDGSGKNWSAVNGVAPSGVTRANNTNQYVTGPTLVLPGPAEASDQMVVNYSRTPYQGDAWGSQTNYIDIPYTPGSLTSGTAFQIASTSLNQAALTRPNQKVLEVLSSTSFTTSLGTGRYSGDTDSDPLQFTDVGYEDPTVYPPTSGVDPRPNVLPGVFSSGDTPNIGSEYLGATERLPLGALYRDKDFRGQIFNFMHMTPLLYNQPMGAGESTGLAVNHQVEQDEVILDTSTSGVGSPGDILVHVDGEQGNYSLLTNFRTYRGGSVFTANGSHPGGEISLAQISIFPAASHTNVVQGRAMLVRNTVTSVGSTEVSAGDELMMLILTNVQQCTGGGDIPGAIVIGTNGAGEGYAAADLYRIEGHPLLRNNVRVNIDPATIALSRKA